jgi:hypothetical protein
MQYIQTSSLSSGTVLGRLLLQIKYYAHVHIYKAYLQRTNDMHIFRTKSYRHLTTKEALISELHLVKYVIC